MSRKISQRETGICPVTNDDETIIVDFVEINAIGMHGYKKMAFHCNIADEVCCSDPNNCPIFLNATNPV